MNVLIDNRLFEWDDEKAALNFTKHGVTFDTAAKVFGDENRIEEYDEWHSIDEDRWQVIGMVAKIIFVVYTERGDFTRLISAREATPRERRKYYARKENY